MSIERFSDVVNDISDISGLIPFLFFVFRPYRIKVYPLLFYLTGITLILYMITRIVNNAGVVVAGYAGYNLYVYHVIGFVELIIIFLFYHRLLHLPRSYWIIFFAVVLFYLLDSIFIEYFLETINAFGRALSFAFLLSLTFYYIISIYSSEEIVTLDKSPTFWINSGFMLYFASSFFTFLFARQFLSFELSNLFSAGWSLHAISHIIKDLILTIGIILIKKDQCIMAK